MLDPYEAIKKAGALAEPFSQETFAQVAGASDRDAELVLSQLMGWGWLQREQVNNQVVYRLTREGKGSAN